MGPSINRSRLPIYRYNGIRFEFESRTVSHPEFGQYDLDVIASRLAVTTNHHAQSTTVKYWS